MNESEHLEVIFTLIKEIRVSLFQLSGDIRAQNIKIRLKAQNTLKDE